MPKPGNRFQHTQGHILVMVAEGYKVNLWSDVRNGTLKAQVLSPSPPRCTIPTTLALRLETSPLGIVFWI